MASPTSIPAHEKPVAWPPSGRGRRPSRRRRFTLALAVVTAFTSGALAWFLGNTALLRLFELKTYDLRFLLRGRESPPRDILIVFMDERTEDAIPEPRIFWQPYFAELFRGMAASGARAIGLDVSFGISVEKWIPDADRQLAAAFAEVSASVPIVLAYDTLQANPESIPLYMLAGASGALGFANLTLDRDSFVRRQELQTRDGAWESFAARLAAVALNRDGGVRDRNLPLDDSGFLLIHYWGPADTFASISMIDALSALRSKDTGQLRRWFGNKIVLVGTRDPSDRRSTPFFLASGGQKLTAGVEIQANTLGTLLQRQFLYEAPVAVTLALVFAGAGIASLIIYLFRFPLAPILLLGLVSVYLAISVVCLSRNLVLSVTPPVVSVFLSGLAGYGAYSLTEGRKRRLLQEVFGRYVSAEMAQELMAFGDIPLGGEEQLVTVMFSDLRNFTSYCQRNDPKRVVTELNEYLADMTAEIKAHGGMVNKFIGDGIMALFGAPVPHADDARRAVACALRMVERNRVYNEGRVNRGLDPLVIGIALHTGMAVVGTIGASQKLEYTAIGDTVNIASRIEGENKTFGSQLLLSEATYKVIREQAICELAGHAALKGISQPVALYKVLGLKGGLES